MTTFIHATKKSAVSSSVGRWNKLDFPRRQHAGNVAKSNSSRAFLFVSNSNINGGPRRSFSSTKLAPSKQVARKALPPVIVDRNYYGGRDANTAAFATRASPGNPSTMAFLGIRAKSSGAAFRHQVDDEEEYDAYPPLGAGGGSSNGIAAGVEGRSHQESWMVNLGREDEAWLIGPRGREWFTGLEPNICPGKGNILSTAKKKN
jgi:hypothetical protein